MNNCRVNVIIPTKNRFRKLRRALKSVNQQDFFDFDVWVINDGSTDETRDYLESSQLKSDYPNISSINILTNKRSVGAAASRNYALAKAGGEFVAFLDDDDVWDPQYLQQQVMQLDQNTDAVATCAQYLECDRSGCVSLPDLRPLFDYQDSLVHLLSECFVHTMSVFVCRRSLFSSIGLLDESLSITHDLDWYSRVLLSGQTIITPSGPALVKREIPGGLVTNHRRWYEEDRRVLDRVLQKQPGYQSSQRHVRAHRELFFAKLAAKRSDYGFTIKRILGAFLCAPVRSVRIVIRRISRNFDQPVHHYSTSYESERPDS